MEVLNSIQSFVILQEHVSQATFLTDNVHSLKGSSWNVTRLLRKQYQFQYIYLLLIEKDIEAISIKVLLLWGSGR